MAKQECSAIISLMFVLTLKTFLCQTKFYNGLQTTHGNLYFPSDVMRTVSSNHSPRRTLATNLGSMSSSKPGTQSQSTIVAIPLYIKNTSPSKSPMLFDLLSASLIESSAKSRKLTDNKPKVSSLSSSKQMSETLKYQSSQPSPTYQRYQSQPQQSIKYNSRPENQKSETPKQDQTKFDDFSEYGSAGHSNSQKQMTQSSSIYTAPQQSQSSQSSNKILFQKSSVPQTQAQEEGQKQRFTDFTSAGNGYEISKLSEAQAIYDASLVPTQNSDSSSYIEKNLSKNTESSEYGSVGGSTSAYSNVNIGSKDPYSSGGLSYSASSFNSPVFTIANNNALSYGSRGSAYFTSGNSGLSYVPSYSSEASNSDSGISPNSGSVYNSAGIGSSSILEDNTYAINNNFSPQSNSGYGSTNANLETGPSSSLPISGKPYRSSSGLYGQQTNTNSYNIPISGSGYSSVTVSSIPKNENYYNNQIMTSYGIGYNSQTSNSMTPTSSLYNPNSQSISSNTFNPNFQSITSSIYNPISSNNYNSNSQLISNNNYNSNSQSLTNSGSNGLYSSSSSDYLSSEESDCYDEKPSTSSDFAFSTTPTESYKSLTNSKSNAHTMPTQTSELTNYETEDIDPSKLDLKIVHLPVSVLKRLVGNGDLALPSFQ